MKTLTRSIKSLIHATGFDLYRLSPSINPAFQLLKALNKFEMNQVFDVGANTGQFALDLRSVGYKGEILSFEPLSEAHASILESSRRDAKWNVFKRCAIGDYDGETKINVAGNSVSSSVLPMLEAHESAAVGSEYVGVEEIPIHKLDSVTHEYLGKTKRTFLKVDTQGYEWQVFDGATQIMPKVYGVLCELSLVPLYEGQKLWLDIINRLESQGFTLWSLQKGFTDPTDGRTLQVDAIFFRI